MKKLLKPLGYTYIFTWLFIASIYVYNSISSTASFSKIIDSFISFATSKSVLILIHSLWLFFFIILIILKYFISVYKKNGFKIFLKQFFSRLIIPILIIIYSIKALIHYNNQEDFVYKWKSSFENNTGVSKKLFLQDNKLRGMNVYRIKKRRSNNNRTIDELIKSNIEWVALLPYFYQETENSKKISSPNTIGVWSRRDSSFINDIDRLHKKEIFVMLKPHLWMSSGWRSNINFDDKKDWETWFSEYRKNMIHYALMAQKTNVELF